MSADAEDGLFPLPVSIEQFRAIFYAVVVLYVAFLLGRGYLGGWANDTIMFPLLVGIPTILVSLVHIGTLLFPEIEERYLPEEDEESLMDQLDVDEEDVGRTVGGRQKYGFIMLGWVIALPVLVFFFGYAYVLPPYVFAFLYYFRRDAKLAASITVAFALAAYVLFIVVLQMIPWAGSLGLPSLINALPF